MAATRQADSRLDILLETPGTQHLCISGTRLPTYNQVLLCYLAHLEKLQSSTAKVYAPSLNAVIEQVSLHYSKANIKILDKASCWTKIKNLHKDYTTLKKIPLGKRGDHSKVKAFKVKLQQTMPFWHRKIIEHMEESKKGKSQVEQTAIDEDIVFMKSMMTDRAAQYSVCDRITPAFIDKRYVKAQQAEKRALNEKKRKFEEISEKFDSDSELEDMEIDYVLPPSVRSHKRTVKTGTTLKVSHDILKSPALVSVATRNKISPTKMSAVLHALITAGNGDTSSVNLHYTTAHRYSIEVHNTIAQKIKKDWKPPAVALLHWDGKLMLTLDGGNLEERLPTLLSGIGGIKLLGVPALNTDSSLPMGEKIASATVSLLIEWKCQDSICGMVFDTTAANTGK